MAAVQAPSKERTNLMTEGSIVKNLLLFALPLFSGIDGVFILYPVSWGLGAVLMALYAWKGKWMEYHT